MIDNQKTTKSDHEIPEHISELGRQVLKNCQKSYINEYDQVIDPCHIYWSEKSDETKW